MLYRYWSYFRWEDGALTLVGKHSAHAESQIKVSKSAVEYLCSRLDTQTFCVNYRIVLRIRMHVFWPPGSGSVSQRYGSSSGSGSIYHQAKIVGKILIPNVLWLPYDFLSFKTYVNIPSNRTKQKQLCRLEGHWRKIAGLVLSWPQYFYQNLINALCW